MVRCVRTADSEWADENVAEALGTYGADVAWVYRPERSLVYSAVSEEKPELDGFLLPESAFAGLRDTQHFAHFFVP
ncbi:hypothetical protein FJY71_04500, partial [candidate division WOR-3 bacterium]|nr:hypothetical protein [candidate division WOR-3 bacterium]